MFKLYHNNKCSKSRACKTILENNNVIFETIEYLKKRLKISQINHIFSNTVEDIDKLVRYNEKIFAKSFRSKIEHLDKNDIIEFIYLNPICLQRPLFYNGRFYKVCRPPELVLDCIKI